MPTALIQPDSLSPHVLVVFPGKQDAGEGWGGVFKASVAHVRALRAAGARVTVWTASRPFATAAATEGAAVDYAACWHSGLTPLFSLRCWQTAARLHADGLVGALHQGGRTGGWGRVLLTGIPQAGVMHRENPAPTAFSGTCSPSAKATAANWRPIRRPGGKSSRPQGTACSLHPSRRP
jgi:hypothetical protein